MLKNNVKKQDNTNEINQSYFHQMFPYEQYNSLALFFVQESFKKLVLVENILNTTSHVTNY